LVLVAIGHTDILPTLFEEVLIPPQVASELASSIIDLEQAFERVKQTDFWISHKLLDERLARFLQRKHAR